MSLTHPTARRNTLVSNETAAIDANTPPGVLKIWTGSPPGANNAATGTLLGTITLANPSFGSPSSGVATMLGVPLSGSCVASGTAGYYRFLDGAGNVVHEGVVATSAADYNFSGGVAFLSGGTITVNSFTITAPA